MRLLSSSALAASFTGSLIACTSPQVASPCQVREGGTAQQRAADIGACLKESFGADVDLSLRRDVDILFLIDNSPSMSPKQAALAQNIPRFIQKIEETGANYHVGIATSDVGTYVAPGQPWSLSLGACNSFEGDDGALQRLPCSARTGLASDAVAACNSLCPDPKFVPQGGAAFISKVAGVTNVPRELVAGKDVGPQRAFQCMALVGDSGCGVEGQLEGARRALDGHNPLNQGFLRPGSVLAVIFITDEDDCSVALHRRSENDPVTMDCSAPSKDAPAACFNPDYRCLARSVVCNEPLNTPGTKTGCREREDSYLEKIDSYVRFFSTVRPANKLLISGVWTLPPIDGGGKLVVSQRSGATRTEGLNRGQGADAGCASAMDPGFFGQSQLRLSRFARQFTGSLEINVCDSDRYPQALDSIAAAIGRILEASCLPAPKLLGGQPLCLVGDVDARTPQSAPDVAFPVCGDGCCGAFAAAARPTAEDAGVKAACAAEASDCYCMAPSQAGACQDGVVFGVWRKGAAPPDKVTSVRCAR